MRIHEDDRAEFEELDEQRRRVNDDFALLVQRMREGSVVIIERLRIEGRQLQVRHEGIMQRMLELAVP